MTTRCFAGARSVTVKVRSMWGFCFRTPGQSAHPWYRFVPRFPMLPLLLLGLALAGGTLASSTASAQHHHMPDPPNEIIFPNEPWPVLADGRVAFDVYGRRIAIPSCGHCQTEVTFHFNPTPTWQGGFLTMKEAIQEPSALRAAISVSKWVDIFFAVDWRVRDHLLSGITGRGYSPRRIALIVYKTPASTSGCWPDADPRRLNKLCETLAEAAIGQHEHLDPDGFVVRRGLENAVTNPYVTRYIVPSRAAQSAIGLPMYFDCDDLFKYCQVGFPMGTGPAFRFEPDLEMGFEFGTADFPKSSWFGLQEQVRAALEDMIVPR
jgi:hypothetical protein